MSAADAREIAVSPRGFIEQSLTALHRQPCDALAIIEPGVSLSFEDLSTAIAALSQDIEQRTRPGDAVALAMERSANLLVAMCACLHAGRPFAPVSPSFPAAYRADILGAIAPALVIAPPGTPNDSTVPIYDMDVQALRNRAGIPPPPRELSDASVAYLLCTSGSSGKPKPVMVSRRGLDNYLSWAAIHYGLCALQGAIAQLAPTFDAFVTQSLLPLLSQRTVLVVPHGEELTRFPQVLSEARGAWLVKVTPGQLLALAADETERSFAHLRGELVVGGEPMTAAHVQWARRLFPQFRIHNEYGPTETVVGSTVHVVPDHVEPPARIPIGRAIAETEILILTSPDREASFGEVGEICIGGAGVTHGYRGMPRATARAFVPHPFGRSSGARLYRTGDYGWADADGMLHYLGRSDRQVKIRGQRVEIADVERRIAALACTAGVAVDVEDDAAGNTLLTAYVQPAPGSTLPEVRERCAAELPASLLPSRWVATESLPLTAHGKVDYRQLRERARIAVSAADLAKYPRLAPMARLWRELLGHEAFGAEDRFFDVGGHSLLLVQLRAQLRTALGASISLADLLEHNTLRGMAARVAAAAPANDLAALPAERSSPFPLSPAQAQIWHASARARREHQPDPYCTVTGLRILGPLDIERLHRAFTDVVERHDAFRLCLIEGEPPTQVLSEKARWQWREETLTEESGLQDLILRMPELDPMRDPLLMVYIIRGSSDRHYLVMRSHHLISDQWSMQLLVRELAAAYRGTSAQGEGGAYRDHCIQQSSCTNDAQVNEHLQYWKRRWADNGVLPAGPHRQSSFAGSALRLDLDIPAAQVLQLEARAAAAGCTMNNVATAIATLGMSLAYELPTVRLACPATLRSAGFENTIGCFLSTICLSATVSADEPVWDTVLGLRDETRAAISHVVPYELLQKHLPLLSTGDLVHARFVFGEDLLAGAALEGCRLEATKLPAPGVKFALMIGARHSASALSFTFDFDPAAYRQTEIDVLSRAFQVAAQALAERPRASVQALREQMNESAEAEFAERAKAMGASLGRALENAATGRAARTARNSVRFSRPGWLKGIVLAEAPSTSQTLTEWISGQTELPALLRESGAVLLRGFGLCDARQFESAVASIEGDVPCDYENRSTPRRRVDGNVFTSTDYPHTETIPLHNENSYSHRWPARIAFLCRRPALRGGETPLADSRRVYEALSPSTRVEFESRGVCYIRNYSSVGLSWQETFQTEDPAALGSYCASHGISHEWLEDGTLRTRQCLQAVRLHHTSGEPLWFNQAHLFHRAGLAAQDAANLLQSGSVPRHATFGDGEEIPDLLLEEIRAAYSRHAVVFPWQRGDVLVLDNMLWAHGRLPFEGPREVLVAMTRPIDDTMCRVPARDAAMPAALTTS